MKPSLLLGQFLTHPLMLIPCTLFYITHLKAASTTLRHLWHSCPVCDCVLALWQAGEGIGIRCGTGEQIAGPGSATEEAAEGAEFRFLPPQDAGTQVRAILSDRHPMYHIPRCLHVRYPSGAQVSSMLYLSSCQCSKLMGILIHKIAVYGFSFCVSWSEIKQFCFATSSTAGGYYHNSQ